jgi:hypothetical protein
VRSPTGRDNGFKIRPVRVRIPPRLPILLDKTPNKIQYHNMKITGNQTVEVEITEEEERKITVAYLCGKFDWDRSYFIESDKVFNTKINHSSHSWEEKVYIREASDDDYCISLILKKLFS